MTAAVTDHGGGDGPSRGMVISWGGGIATPVDQGYSAEDIVEDSRVER